MAPKEVQLIKSFSDAEAFQAYIEADQTKLIIVDL